MEIPANQFQVKINAQNCRTSRKMEDFCGGHEKLKHVLMGHEIFLKNFDGPRNTFLFSPLVISSFEYECKISKLAVKEI